MASFGGIWVPIITPFQSGQVDYESLQKLVSKLIHDGVQGVVVCGTTGEAAALSEEEQLKVLDAVLALMPSDQVVMGLSGNNLSKVLDFQQKIQHRRLAGLLVSAPYYIRPSQKALEGFFQQIADAATVPVVLYDIPERAAVRIETATLRQIVKHPKILAIKDCGGDIEKTMALIADGNVEVLAGDDIQILNTLCLGGAGAIPASAHVRADLYVAVYRATQRNDLQGAREIFYRLHPWISAAFSEPNPSMIKGALAHQGLISNELRLPMLPCAEESMITLRAVLEDLAG